MRILHWFRADLRTVDNRALDHAVRHATEGIVGVFLVARDQWADHDWGENRIDFVMRSVAALCDKLNKLNIPLIIRNVTSFADAPKVLAKVASETDCDRLVFNREYEVNEITRDIATEKAFDKAGLSVRSFHDQVILRPASIQTKTGNFYTVFTPYKKTWLDEAKQSPDIDPLGNPKKQKPIDVDTDTLAVNDALTDFAAGEDEAIKRLNRFVDNDIRDYKNKRDLPGVDGTSTLSPYLAVGAISPRQCLAAAVDANKGKLDNGYVGPDTWISELVWREFYRHIVVGFPRVSKHRAFKCDTEKITWSDNEHHFEAWCAGRTGVPIVDAAMRQLLTTGWMHNRCRMIVAMFFTKNLWLDWRRGERFFMNHLVDGDLASNNGGWQWSASTGTDAAPYFRIFNPVSQSERFDPDGEYIRRYVEELADVDAPEIHDPSPLTRSACDYPEMIVDLKKSRAGAIAKFKESK